MSEHDISPELEDDLSKHIPKEYNKIKVIGGMGQVFLVENKSPVKFYSITLKAK